MSKLRQKSRTVSIWNSQMNLRRSQKWTTANGAWNRCPRKSQLLMVIGKPNRSVRETSSNICSLIQNCGRPLVDYFNQFAQYCPPISSFYKIANKMRVVCLKGFGYNLYSAITPSDQGFIEKWVFSPTAPLWKFAVVSTSFLESWSFSALRVPKASQRVLVLRTLS